MLAAEAGLFENVLVLDFRTLYPSLIRTFHLDPLAHARATARPRPDDLVAPNGARFDRTEGILPGILERYAREREAALRAGDETAAYVYKILQNSFYGVLGASGCRYARTELAASPPSGSSSCGRRATGSRHAATRCSTATPTRSSSAPVSATKPATRRSPASVASWRRR